jgi:hypothetical protein
VPDDSNHELPERYAPLVKYVSTKFPKQTIAFESAFRRIESRRLLAEHKLRKTFQGYWSTHGAQLKVLRPLDVVYCFEEYVVTVFNTAGEECLGLFQSAESFGSFLSVVQGWIIDAILPKPEPFEQSQAKQLAWAEKMLGL